MKTITKAGPMKLTKGQCLRRDIWRSRELYLFLLPGYVVRGIAEVPGIIEATTTTDGHIYTLPRININGYGT